jgi:subtilisin family serine protease
MRTIRLASFLTAGLLVTGTATPPALAAPLPSDTPARIAVSDAPAPVEPVEAWDPGSPQKLVRIGGTLFQEDSGFFYRVVEDRITVRLADGVRDWADLVDRANAAAPGTFADLGALTVERQNRLGIVDLIIPDRFPTDWCELVFQTGLVRYAEVASYGVFVDSPNDPYYPQQWALNNTGQTGGTPGADVDAEAAWDLETGDPAIVVGVLDSGTAVGHQDLDLNVWHNDGEIPGNGVDDDGNGYIDDVDGWDFGNDNNNVNSNNYHGTHVTGIIIAEGDNGIGVVGLAGGVGSAGVRAMAVAVGESAPITSVMDDAMLYAVDNGAHVVTMSLTVGETQAFNDAMDYAYNTMDVFIDCAAGNNGSSVGYPATRPEVMAVASTNHHDHRSSFSNPGPQLEISAPGEDIWSTRLGNTYGSGSGTSYAAPYVGALAAMIRSVNSGLTAPEVRQLIIDTAEDVESPGHDNLTGWGRINAYEAISQAGFSDGTVELNADLYTCSDVVRVTAMDFDLGGQGTTTVTVKSSTEPQGEDVLLIENNFGVFFGAISLSDGAAVPDGLLQVAHGDTVTAEYLDADDGQGGINVMKTDTALMDCLGPQIFSVAAVNVDNRFATIIWTTDEPGTSVVRYGSAIPPDQQASSGALTALHTLTLSDLEECTTYKFEVESADALGNLGVDDNGGAYYTFQTLGFFPGVGVVPCQRGQAQLDRFVYGCSSTVLASVVDIDLDTDAGAPDEVQVLMTSTSEPSGEWITLTETTADSGKFEGTIELDAVAPAPDGVLAVSTGNLVTVTYFDEDDGQGHSHIATATSTTECVAPSILDLQVTAISATRAEITWTTNEPATSRVEFGESASLGSVAEDLELTTSHRLAVSAFENCDRAFFRVSSTDEHGDVRVADAAGQPFEFNLNEIGGLVFHDNFEVDNGWDLSGEWERGTPQAQGSGSGDPQLAYSGSGVLGIDLSGAGSLPGDYEPNVTEWAYSPPLNTLGFTNLELILRRKLGLASDDSASIVVKNLLHQSVWTSANGIDDADWVEIRHPIPNADDQAAVQVGFQLSSGPTGQSYGWNIDEIIVKDSTLPDYRVCGECAGAPSFGGLAAVHDPAPCGASGLTLDWQPAPAWGTGSGGTYDVHRATTPDFIPDAANRIASGLTTTTWTDSTAPVNTEVWYGVRARNDEDCTGGEGLADDNLVRLAATETVSQPLPPGLGATLRVAAVGRAHVRLSWDALAGVDHYVVRRSESPDFGSAEEIGTTTGTLFEDVDAANDGNSYFYKVSTVNACGQETP